MTTRFVDIETPYSGKTEEELRLNLLYARACVRDSLLQGEIPFASHLFFTQPGILDDTNHQEREKGIQAGKSLIEALQNIITVVYTDLGISDGMEYGINRAEEQGRRVEFRRLGPSWERKALEISRQHSHAVLWRFNHF